MVRAVVSWLPAPLRPRALEVLLSGNAASSGSCRSRAAHHEAALLLPPRSRRGCHRDLTANASSPCTLGTALLNEELLRAGWGRLFLPAVVRRALGAPVRRPDQRGLSLPQLRCWLSWTPRRGSQTPTAPFPSGRPGCCVCALESIASCTRSTRPRERCRSCTSVDAPDSPPASHLRRRPPEHVSAPRPPRGTLRQSWFLERFVGRTVVDQSRRGGWGRRTGVCSVLRKPGPTRSTALLKRWRRFESCRGHLPPDPGRSGQLVAFQEVFMSGRVRHVIDRT